MCRILYLGPECGRSLGGVGARAKCDADVEAVEGAAASSVGSSLVHRGQVAQGDCMQGLLYSVGRASTLLNVLRVDRRPLTFHVRTAQPHLGTGVRVRLSVCATARIDRSDLTKIFCRTMGARSVYTGQNVADRNVAEWT